jgi:uncharacterized protein DUF4337
MSEFNAAHALNEAKERHEQLVEGDKLVPILAAIIAVFAAIATLFANHSSISGLASKNEAILSSSKATDTWNYYQAKRLKIEVNNALIRSGAANSAAGLRQMRATVSKEDTGSQALLTKAQQLDAESDDSYERSERFMQAYEKYEVSATLFEVSIVLISITALMAGNKALMYVAGGATLIGVVFFVQGALLH